MSDLLPVHDALAKVLAAARPIRELRELPLIQALGYTLAEDVISAIDVPPADNSAMDGYALRASEAKQPLPVSQRIPAGVMGAALSQRSAARIFTGAVHWVGSSVGEKAT